MKKNLGLILLIFILCIIAIFLAYTVISKQNLSKESFNIQKGETLSFDKYNTIVKILNVAAINPIDKKQTKEVEVSLEVYYNDEKSNYTLNSKTAKQMRIKNSNNYVILNYKDNIITIDIKDRNELN